MLIFISHSFLDKDQFDNIADALETGLVPYWKPSQIVAGAMLSDQLRDAISRSRACVFIATRNSVDSPWCNAELGAFWGAGKPVFVFVADASLTDDKLPKQFQGHFLEKRITKLVQTCKEYMGKPDAAGADSYGPTTTNPDTSLSRADLVELIETAIDRVTIRASALGAFSHLSAALQSLTESDIESDRVDSAAKTAIYASLHQFLGLSKSAIQDVAGTQWPYTVELQTTSGRWMGFARTVNEETSSPTGEDYVYRPCILFRFDDNFRVVTSAFLTQVGDYNLRGMQARSPVAVAGRGNFGEKCWYVTD